MENKIAPSWTANKKSEEAIDEQTSLDILCGKDSISLCHIGNRCFRALVGFGIEELTQTAKNKFINAIIKSICRALFQLLLPPRPSFVANSKNDRTSPQ
jgi:hypothetical protein